MASDTENRQNDQSRGKKRARSEGDETRSGRRQTPRTLRTKLRFAVTDEDNNTFVSGTPVSYVPHEGIAEYEKMFPKGTDFACIPILKNSAPFWRPFEPSIPDPENEDLEDDHADANDDSMEPKKLKEQEYVKCDHCGRLGHPTIICPSKQYFEDEDAAPKPTEDKRKSKADASSSLGADQPVKAPEFLGSDKVCHDCAAQFGAVVCQHSYESMKKASGNDNDTA